MSTPVVVARTIVGSWERFSIGNNRALYRYDQAASGAWGSAQSMAWDAGPVSGSWHWSWWPTKVGS